MREEREGPAKERKKDEGVWGEGRGGEGRGGERRGEEGEEGREENMTTLVVSLI
jgi:hypothetical protein